MKIINWIKQNPWLVAILVVAAFLRFYKLDFQSIWLDEILSMNDSNPKLSWDQFYDGIMFWEFLPHLYFFILRIALEIFGFTSEVGRGVSAIIGIIGVYSVYLLGHELFTKKTGLVAAALVAVNIFHISHSQEIRPYGLLFLFTTLAFYRLVIFVKDPTRLNAIIYGCFAGLILHAHFFGLITLFSQCVLLLFFLFTRPSIERRSFLIMCIVAGISALIVFIPAIEPFIRVSEIESFWLQKPGPDAFTVMYHDFFGNSEWILFIIQLVVIYYCIRLFKKSFKKDDKRELTAQKLTFSFLILFCWLFFSVLIPLLRSHLDVPMILIRYFINILPAIIIVIAIGISLIKNRVIQRIVIIYFIIFSLVDLFAVNKYYSTVTKSQFRELTADIKAKNEDNIKIVVFWSWIFAHFFEDNPATKIEQRLLDEHVEGMRKGQLAHDAFWYADANSRPISISDENLKYLEEHFNLKYNLQYHDAWARLYVPKVAGKIDLSKGLPLSMLNPVHQDAAGNIYFFENSTLSSPQLDLEPGRYELYISGKSYPNPAIDNQNAQLTVKLNGQQIGDIFLSEKGDGSEHIFSFDLHSSKKSILSLTFSNDMTKDGEDRNLSISSIKFQRMQD